MQNYTIDLQDCLDNSNNGLMTTNPQILLINQGIADPQVVEQTLKIEDSSNDEIPDKD